MTNPLHTKAAEAIRKAFIIRGDEVSKEEIALIISQTLAAEVPKEAGEVAESMAEAIFNECIPEAHEDYKLIIERIILPTLTPIFTAHAATVERLRSALQWAVAQANAYGHSNDLWGDPDFKRDYLVAEKEALTLPTEPKP